MSQYLVFQLHGPMASWGVDAPGEVRHTHALPSRSALLGLLAAALGIRREEEERLNEFNQHYALVVCASKHSHWARDFHTIQMPKEARKIRYFSRREELGDPSRLGTLISRRDYYTDGWWMVALKATPGAPVALDTLRDALCRPVFPLCLGRKSHPLALPVSPLLLEGSCPEVLHTAHGFYSEKLAALGKGNEKLAALQSECWWEGEHDGLHETKVHRRRDRPLSRQHWLFGERNVSQGPLPLFTEELCISQK